MPCTGTPRWHSGSPMPPVPMASSSALPLPANSASRLTAGSIASGRNLVGRVVVTRRYWLAEVSVWIIHD